MSIKPKKTTKLRSYLWQRRQTLLLDVPDDLIGRELQALVHVQLGHVDPHQEPPVPRFGWRLVVEHHRIHPDYFLHCFTYFFSNFLKLTFWQHTFSSKGYLTETPFFPEQEHTHTFAGGDTRVVPGLGSTFKLPLGWFHDCHELFHVFCCRWGQCWQFLQIEREREKDNVEINERIEWNKLT